MRFEIGEFEVVMVKEWKDRRTREEGTREESVSTFLNAGRVTLRLKPNV